MNQAIVYHWWGHASDADPVCNLRTPIIASIASLRNVSNIPVYVIDVSPDHCPQNWEDYPAKLNFKIHKQKPHLEKWYSEYTGYQNLSRIFDIARFQNQIPEEEIIYADSDIFFFTDPTSFERPTNRFCFNRYNSGYYYYNKTSDTYLKFQELFEAYAITALNDENFRYVSEQFGDNYDYFVLDETLLKYMENKHPELFHIIPAEEHFTIRDLNNVEDINQVKMFHANGTWVPNKVSKHQYEELYCRGLVCIIFKELYESITKLIEPEKFFTVEEIQTYLPKQRSFFDKEFLNRWRDNTNEKGLAQLDKVI